MLWLTIVIFVIILGILVFVHELGHFLMARKFGCKIMEFGFGFPPRLWGFKRGETVYSINAIPIGGFVRILGEDGSQPNNPRSFAAKAKLQRFWILVAGVGMNFALAVTVLAIGFMTGLPGSVDSTSAASARIVRDMEVRIVLITPDSPAQTAGFKMGDAISAIDGQPVRTTGEAINLINERRGREAEFAIGRGEEDLSLTAALRQDPPEGEGPLGAVLGESGIIAYPWPEAVWRSVQTTGLTVVQMFWVVGELIKNLFGFGDQTVMQNVAGPVGIAVLTDTFRKLGFPYLLWFAAFLSINLGIINILPFPALDGGRLIFLGAEAVRGKKVSVRFESLIHTIGFLLLIFLMVIITLRDITKFSEPFKNLWDKIF